jgi:hypothetical protein
MKYDLLSFEMLLNKSKQIHFDLFPEQPPIKYMQELEYKTRENFDIFHSSSRLEAQLLTPVNTC